jgi:two-component SAPR family response regulator
MIRAIVVDDEKHAINVLQDLLSDYRDIELIAQFTSPYQALSSIGELAFDIAFLDIEMPGMNGLELGERLLEADASIDIVYITAFDAYAVEAFEVCALDYLLKPVSSRRMKKTMERIRAKRYGIKTEPEPLPEDSPCRVRCFGRFEIVLEGADSPYIPWRTAKARELLAYLVHYRGQRVGKPSILEAVWPGLEADRASVYLHTCIYQIRKTIKQYRMENQISVRFIQDGYQLTLSGVGCDVDVFVCSAASGEEGAEPDWGSLEAAERLYAGGYYTQDDFPWAAEAQRELEASYIHTVQRLAERDAAHGLDLSAVRRWGELVRLEPYNEDYHDQLLRLYAKAGDRASVIKHYKQMAALLREELHLDPRPATEQLVRSLLSTMEQGGAKR